MASKKQNKRGKNKESLSRSKVVWREDPEAVTEPLATCGNWRAELAYKDIYSEGLVFIKYKNKHKVPAYFGDKRGIQAREKAMILIEEVCQRMVRTLTCPLPCKCKCQNVYIVSLNEGDLEKTQREEDPSVGLHFRLLPRYQHDEGFLKRINSDGTDNDGFALMAEWRKQFLRRKKTGKWDWFPVPDDVSPRARRS